MPSEAAKRRQAQKKERRQAGGRRKQQQTSQKTEKPIENGVGESTPPGEEAAPEGACAAPPPSRAPALKLSARSCTGVLTSHLASRDVHVANFSLSFHGMELLVDTKLELNCGRRYGLVGLNGSGKSTMLAAISSREIPIPNHIDIFHLSEEMPASDKTPLECVMEVDEERLRLEAEVEELVKAGDSDSDRLLDVYDRLEELDAATAEVRAARILHGLGFTAEMQAMRCSDFSGGWRMRVSLARALFVHPALLLLDEPTNHLDLEACVWLEEELKRYKRILVLVSHSQDFLNGVCTNIIHLHKTSLQYYGGNYDAYVKTREELEENQMKMYNWEQAQMQHMKDYIARFGHGTAKLARQAQSKEKVLAKMVAGGLTERVVSDKVISFRSQTVAQSHPQSLWFRIYSPDRPFVYKNIDFGIDLETRLALVGPNGAGKSTLLKLIDGELVPTDGLIRRHSHVRAGRYHQHLKDHLDLDVSALRYMMKCFPDEKEEEQMRRALGRYGLTGKQQICPMKNLSDGQRCRVIFAWLGFHRPHLLLLDEPTNHLDMETIDSLAFAINSFEGGMILVSHDFRLISQVAKEIWVCQAQGVHPWPGDIQSYKAELRKKAMKI